MSRDEIVKMFARRDEAWANKDVETLTAAHADDGVIVSPMFGIIHGRAAIEKSYRDIFHAMSDWRLDSESLIIDDDNVAQIFKVHATHVHEMFGVPGTGRRFTTNGVTVFQLRDGKIAHEQRFYDFTGLLLQLGVLKAKPK
jgi:steroid delta-isomerase-like uncharacterized protein